MLLTGCSAPSAERAAIDTQHRDPRLLDWPARGDLTHDTRVVRQGVCCVGDADLDRHGRAVLFAGHVPGGAVVITQVASTSPRGGWFTDAGQFPLADDGTPLVGSGTTIQLPTNPAGISAVLQVPSPDAQPGSFATLAKNHPFLLLIAGPGVDAADYSITRGIHDRAVTWTTVTLHRGWATVQLPTGANGEQLRVRWRRAAQVVEVGLPDTPYPF
jgi:hypothetical protein